MSKMSPRKNIRENTANKGFIINCYDIYVENKKKTQSFWWKTWDWKANEKYLKRELDGVSIVRIARAIHNSHKTKTKLFTLTNKKRKKKDAY